MYVPASQLLKGICLQDNTEIGTVHFAQTVYSNALLWGTAKLLTTDAGFCAQLVPQTYALSLCNTV